MKSIIRDFAKVCYALLFLISTKALAQENSSLTVTPEVSKQLIDMYAQVLKVSYMEVDESKRLGYMIDGEVTDLNQFTGKYTRLPEKYQKATKTDSKGKYVAYELVDNSKGYDEYYLSQSTYSIIRNDETQKFYAIDDMYLSHLDKIRQEKEMVDVIHKLGYKEYVDGGEMYIKSKTSEIRFDSYTYNELKKNPSYITTLDNDQIKIASLVKQTILHSKTLDRYLSLYNIKRSKMSSVDIKAWRTATTNAQKLSDQIYKLNEKYEGNYSFTLLDKSSTLDRFLDNLNASKGVLGM